MRLIILASLFITAVASTAEGWPPDKSGLVHTDWTGTWHGVAQTFPEGQYGDGWHKTIVIGTYPADGGCTVWNSTFTHHGAVQLTKDYRLCREKGASNLYIDAGAGGKLEVQRMNDILVSPFKVNGMFTVSSLRMRGDTLEEEIIMANDKPDIENTLISLPAHTLYQIKMQRL